MKASLLTRTTVAVSLLCGFVGECAFAAQPVSDAARDLLLEFDRAWEKRDVAAMMRNVSPTFGCSFYGGLGAAQLEKSYTLLLEELPATRCATQVVRITEKKSMIQAYVRREFFPLDSEVENATAAPLETQCLVVYMQRLAVAKSAATTDGAAALRIVSLEEYDPSTLSRIQGDRYVDPETGLSLDLPDGLFVVAAPHFQGLLQLVLRTEDLHGELLVSLELFADPFELEPAFDQDLRDFQKHITDADVERRHSLRVASYPALRADGTYRGGACSLQPQNPDESHPRTFARVYAQPDPAILLSIRLDAETRIVERLRPRFDELLAGVQLSTKRGETYGDGLRRRLGFGPLVSGTFRCRESGFSVAAPPGFTLERVPSAGCFALRARRASDALTVTLEANELIDPDCDPSEIAELDDDMFLSTVSELAGPHARVEHARVTLGALSGLRVDRAAGSPRASGALRSNIAFYAIQDRYLMIAEVQGDCDDATARAVLESVVRGVRCATR